jgi:DNA-binding NarL/FixJ family response regulator
LTTIIADDHERERVWLSSLLKERLPSLLPVYEARNGEEAIELSRTNKADLVLLDIEMPGISVIKATEAILSTHPQTGVVIISHHSEEVWVRQLWKVMPPEGSFAYVLKDASDDQIVDAISAVVSGDCWIHPRIQRVLMQFKSPGTLSDGEFEVLACICMGLTDRTIAGRLYLTEKAIQARLKSVYGKLAIPLKGAAGDDLYNHRCRAINIAMRRGLITRLQLDEWESEFAKELG